MRRMITLSIVLVATGTLVAQQAAISRTVLQQADISVAGREVGGVRPPPEGNRATVVSAYQHENDST